MIRLHELVINCPTGFDGEPAATCNCDVCTKSCDQRRGGPVENTEEPLTLGRLDYAEFCSPGLVQNAVERRNSDTFGSSEEEGSPMRLTADRERDAEDSTLRPVPGVFRPSQEEQDAMDRIQQMRLGLIPFPGAPAKSFG
jgi:hypothetical protein